MRISDWSSDVCSSDLIWLRPRHRSGLTGLGGLIVGGNRVRSLMLLAASYFFPLALSADFSTHRASFGGSRPHSVRMRRSEEHTSELQSLMRISYAVFCLKKKTTTTDRHAQKIAIIAN